MAGDFAVGVQVAIGDLDLLYTAGLEIDILVDLTHNANFVTVGDDGDVMQKGIELDVRISRGAATQAAWDALVVAAAAAGGAVQAIVNGMVAWGGFAQLNQRACKVEIPTFATDIFDPGSPPDATSTMAVAACLAAAAAFDALDDYERQCFGMYRRAANGSVAAVEAARGPRTRKP